MKFAQIYKLIEENPKKQTPPPVEVDPLRSNIDQFWMNTDDLRSDLYKFLERVQNKDPELARSMRNTIRNVLAKFRYEQPKQEQPIASPTEQ